MKRSLIAILLILFALFFFASCDEKDNDGSTQKDGIYPPYLDLSELEGMDNVTKCDKLASPKKLTEEEIAELLSAYPEEYQELPEHCDYATTPLCDYIIEINENQWTICTPSVSMSYLCGLAYVEYLNKNNFCSINKWRLPTPDELESLYASDNIRVDGYDIPIHIIPPFHLDGNIIHSSVLTNGSSGSLLDKNISYYNGTISSQEISHGDPEINDDGVLENLVSRILLTN